MRASSLDVIQEQPAAIARYINVKLSIKRNITKVFHYVMHCPIGELCESEMKNYHHIMLYPGGTCFSTHPAYMERIER